MNSWNCLADWWLEELTRDPAYEKAVTPLLVETLRPRDGASYVDLGCGQGRVAASVMEVAATVWGLEAAETLAHRAWVQAVVGDVLSMPFREGAFDGAYAVLVLEHLEVLDLFFEEAARVVTNRGILAVVANHPMWTAPGSTPIQDADGEVLWRPGEYFSVGKTEVQVPGGVVTFFHRSLGMLLTAAADAGWALEELIEPPHHEIDGQRGIPRLLACRWRR